MSPFISPWGTAGVAQRAHLSRINSSPTLTIHTCNCLPQICTMRMAAAATVRGAHVFVFDALMLPSTSKASVRGGGSEYVY